jgi:hypothetical protein
MIKLLVADNEHSTQSGWDRYKPVVVVEDVSITKVLPVGG